MVSLFRSGLCAQMWSHPALFRVGPSYTDPHLTERTNFDLGLTCMPKARIEAKVLQLSNLHDRKPVVLSGGRCQRAVFGRAIATYSRVSFVNAPLSNFDAAQRGDRRLELTILHARLGQPLSSRLQSALRVILKTAPRRVARSRHHLCQQGLAPAAPWLRQASRALPLMRQSCRTRRCR